MNVRKSKKITALLLVFMMLISCISTTAAAFPLAEADMETEEQTDVETADTGMEGMESIDDGASASIPESENNDSDVGQNNDSDVGQNNDSDVGQNNDSDVGQNNDSDAGQIVDSALDPPEESGLPVSQEAAVYSERAITHLLHWNSSLDSLDGYTLTGSGSDLEITPTDNSDQSVILQIDFTLGGDQPAEPGEIEIRIPLSIFSDRDGNAADTINIPLVQAPEESGMTNFHYYIDYDTGEVVITNYAQISTAVYFTCDVKYTFLPSDIEDGYVNSDIYADFTITLAGQEPVEYHSDDLTVTVNTDAKISGLTKQFSNKCETWQASWGQAPADADDYFYVMWQVTYTAPGDCTQPYTVDFVEETDGQGIFVGASSYASGSGLDGALQSIPIEVPGTSPSTYRQYVLMKYPKNLIEENEDTIITNEITAELTGVDGASDSKSANAEYSYKPVSLEYPGAVYKIGKAANDKNIGMINLIENDRFEMLGEGTAYSFYISAVTQAWASTEDGTEQVTTQLVDDLFFIGDEQLQPGDYEITSCYLSFVEYNYVISPDSGYQAVAATDYTSYSPVNIYYQTGGGSSWQLAGTVKRDLNNVYLFTDTNGNTSQCGTSSQIPIPSGASAIKFSHTSSRYQVRIDANIRVTLNPTQHVKSLVANLDSVKLYNVDSLLVTDSEGKIINGPSLPGLSSGILNQVKEHDEEDYGQTVQHGQANTTLTRLTGHTNLNKTSGSVISDVANGQELLNYRIDFCDEAAYTQGVLTVEEVKALGIVTEQTEGAFYDLLPAGTAVDPSTISVTTFGNNEPCSFTVETVRNWQNSGQTMLIVYVTAPAGSENFYNYTATSPCYFTSGFTLTYQLVYTWENIHDYGQTALNSVAYRSDDGTLNDGMTAGESGITNDEFFVDLDNDSIADDTNKNTVYGENSTVLSPLEAVELGFSKAVAAADELTYERESEVSASGTYNYRLRFNNARDVTASNLVFYDTLESYNSGDAVQWKGTFESVDTTYSESKGIAPVVYYSTVAGLQPSQDGNADLTDTNIWSTQAPADLSSVTAIAVDMSKKTDGSLYVLAPEEVVLCYITMRAPANYEDYTDPDVYAYNSAWAQLIYQTISGDPVESISESNATQVSLRYPDIAIEKSADPASGTEERPTPVDYGDIIRYTVSVTNTNTTEAMTGVEVTDLIPDGLDIDLNRILYYFGEDPDDAAPISTSDAVSVTADGQKLVFMIKKLLADETISFIIPVTVSEDVEPQEVLDNTATITQINGGEYAINSNTTYHIAATSALRLTGSKHLTGKELEDGMFHFIVRDEAGNIAAVATNQADGAIVFSNIVFEAAGNYTFTVTEQNGGANGITYDVTAYIVTVEVTEYEDGTLYAVPVYPEGGIVFQNEYSVTDDPIADDPIADDPIADDFIADDSPSGNSISGGSTSGTTTWGKYNPKTGDPTSLGSWIALFLVSGGTMVTIWFKRRKAGNGSN